MGRLATVAPRVTETCSPATPTARVLRPCIVSPQPLLLLTPTELVRMGWFYRGTRFTGRRGVAAARALARCSPSTLMAQILRPCILSRQPPVMGGMELEP